MKSMILAAVCAAALVAGAADEKQPETKMTARLVDGSTLVGAPKFETLKVKLAFAESKIPVGLVSSLDFTSNSVKVTFTNKDVLTGEPQFDELAVKASFGDVDLKIANLRGVTFSKAVAAGGDWLSFTTPGFPALSSLGADPRCSQLFARPDYVGFFEGPQQTLVQIGKEYQFSYKGAQGDWNGNTFMVWLKLNRTTGQGAAVWQYANGGGVNAYAGTFTKQGNVWRSQGMCFGGHPVAFLVRDDSSYLTMRWGSALEGRGSSYLRVKWHQQSGDEEERSEE